MQEPDPKAVRAHIEAGDLILAYDLLSPAIADGVADPQLRYLYVLALARMGATESAMAQYQQLGVGDIETTDTQALGARLLKDQAFASQPDQRPELLSKAADAYMRIHENSGDAYPAVNASSLYFLADETERAAKIARDVTGSTTSQAPASYYDHATLAEAHVVLGDFEAARRALIHATDCPDASIAARAGTGRQLLRILDHCGVEAPVKDALLDCLKTGTSLHFCGRMFAEDAEIEEELGNRIEAFLAANEVAAAFGSLACGADILIAERLMDRGIPVYIVLASPEKSFLQTSVAIGGDGWAARFNACVEKARDVVSIGDPFYANDPIAFALASNVAMGMAVSFAGQNGCDLHQLAITEGEETVGAAGTNADMKRWMESGRPTTTLAAKGIRRPKPADNTFSDNRGDGAFNRRAVSLLFADFAGFTSISDQFLPNLLTDALNAMAELFEDYADDVVIKNTWGDACFVAFKSNAFAAKAALELPRRLNMGEFGKLGLRLRVSLHHGIVLELEDPVLGRTNLFGREVSRAARIEPITPPGCVYASQQFVSIAMNDPHSRIDCQYVGKVPLAKKYGNERLYLITGCSLDDDHK